LAADPFAAADRFAEADRFAAARFAADDRFAAAFFAAVFLVLAAVVVRAVVRCATAALCPPRRRHKRDRRPRHRDTIVTPFGDPAANVEAAT
jgi:hypothetical protein